MKKRTTLKAVDDPREDERTRAEAVAAYIACIVTDPRTPRAAQVVINGILINCIANVSSYDWTADAEGLRFMLPRLLENMNEMFADGVTESLQQAIEDLLPGDLQGELFRASNKEGRAS